MQKIILSITLLLGILLIACDNNNTSNPSNDTTNTLSNTTKAKEIDSNLTPHTKEQNINLASPQMAQKSGEELYKKCIACHGAKGEKVAPGSIDGVLIGDLSKENLAESLKGYRARTLNKSGKSAIMYLQANNLSDEDIVILSEYIASFK